MFNLPVYASWQESFQDKYMWYNDAIIHGENIDYANYYPQKQKGNFYKLYQAPKDNKDIIKTKMNYPNYASMPKKK